MSDVLDRFLKANEDKKREIISTREFQALPAHSLMQAAICCESKTNMFQICQIVVNREEVRFDLLLDIYNDMELSPAGRDRLGEKILARVRYNFEAVVFMLLCSFYHATKKHNTTLLSCREKITDFFLNEDNDLYYVLFLLYKNLQEVNQIWDEEMRRVALVVLEEATNEEVLEITRFRIPHADVVYNKDALVNMLTEDPYEFSTAYSSKDNITLYAQTNEKKVFEKRVIEEGSWITLLGIYFLLEESIYNEEGLVTPEKSKRCHNMLQAIKSHLVRTKDEEEFKELLIQASKVLTAADLALLVSQLPEEIGAKNILEQEEGLPKEARERLKIAFVLL